MNQSQRSELQMKSWSELCQSEEWYQRKKEIWQLYNNQCAKCQSKDFLEVHHKYYMKDANGRLLPWEYPDEALVTLCRSCHQMESNIKKFERHKTLQGLEQVFWYTQLSDFVPLLQDACLKHGNAIMTAAIKNLCLNSDLILRLANNETFEPESKSVTREALYILQNAVNNLINLTEKHSKNGHHLDDLERCIDELPDFKIAQDSEVKRIIKLLDAKSNE
jgi:hypothetical protein